LTNRLSRLLRSGPALGALIALAGLGIALHLRSEVAAPPDALVVPDWALLDHTGAFHQLSRYRDRAAVVLFVHGVGCPVSRQSVPALRALRSRFSRDRVAILLLNGNPQDDRAALQQEAALLEPNLPILKDDSQLVLERLRITRTGEVFVLDPRTWHVVYRGPLDDRLHYEGARPAGGRRDYAADAVQGLLDGRAPTGKSTPAPVIGCVINTDELEASRRRPLTYTGDAAPILRERCVMCHRPGGIGPWAMDGYARVKGWAPMMREVILTRRMPPWNADPAVGRFAHDRSLTVAEQRTLVHWIDAGAPRGEGPDPLVVAADVVRQTEWPLGPPDLVVELPEQEVPASGETDYRYVRIPVTAVNDQWVRAVDLRPANRAVAHHLFAFLDYPARLRDRQPEWWRFAMNTFFAAYAPGLEPTPLPEGSGLLLPAGATFVFQLHYTSAGYATTDRPKLGLYFHREPPRLEYRVGAVAQLDLRIPPFAPDHEVQATRVLTTPVVLHDLAPHMHYRGSRFRFEAISPDGRREALLSVPRFQFAWQAIYQLQAPRRLPAGTTIVATGAFDNSPQNPANPDPSREVHWGGKSRDEMFIGYFGYTVPRVSP
jgi:AhpC/TSA family